MPRSDELTTTTRSTGASETLRVALLLDSPEEASTMRRLLCSNGMEVSHQSRADAFVEMLRRDSFDLLVVDLGIQRSSGLQVLRRVRNDLGLTVPLIMTAPAGNELEVVQALQGGADDYLFKPWRSVELMARIQVLTLALIGRFSGSEEIRAGWLFDAASQRIKYGEMSVRLPRKDFEVAQVLFMNLGHSVSRRQLSHMVWGAEVTSRKLDTHVSRVRTALELTGGNGFTLQAVYGLGYRIDRHNPQAS